MDQDEAEKMAALKRAYADIILNTAKEAATRILVVKRKARGFQQELFEVKEDALATLLRVKRAMDSKIAETEKVSLGRRQKIQELEAQLNEAEEKVVDLRMELKRVQDELERMKNSKIKQVDECSMIGPELVLPSYVVSAQLNQRSGNDKCFMSENVMLLTEPSDGLPSRNYSVGNNDVPAIIMRIKDTELYRNGCTQRIGAFEQNWLKKNIQCNGQNDDGSHLENELMAQDKGKMKQTCTTTSPKVENVAMPKETEQRDNCDKGGGVVRFFHRSLRKQQSKYNHFQTVKSATMPDKLAEALESSNAVSSSELKLCSQNKNTKFDENPSTVIGEETQKDSDSHFTYESAKQSEILDENHHPDILPENEDPSIHVEGAESDPNSSKVLMKGLMSITNHQKHSDTSDVSNSKTNLETVDVPMASSDIKDEKKCETAETPTQAVNDKLLKYTFQRKRKRVSSSTQIEDGSSFEKKNCSKRKTAQKEIVDKQGPLLESQKPTVVVESSRDNRRLVQVARQLISLSGKQWR